MISSEEVATIPLLEERISVSKKEVETGRLRVAISVDAREERVPVTLTHDEIEVERVATNVPVTEYPKVRIEGDTTIIPVVEEVVVVEKRLVVVEEIRVRRKAQSATQEVPMTVRFERAKLERTGRNADRAETMPEAGNA